MEPVVRTDSQTDYCAHNPHHSAAIKIKQVNRNNSTSLIGRYVLQLSENLRITSTTATARELLARSINPNSSLLYPVERVVRKKDKDVATRFSRVKLYFRLKQGRKS